MHRPPIVRQFAHPPRHILADACRQSRAVDPFVCHEAWEGTAEGGKSQLYFANVRAVRRNAYFRVTIDLRAIGQHFTCTGTKAIGRWCAGAAPAMRCDESGLCQTPYAVPG